MEPLQLLTSQDEVWIKLDAGTPEHFEKINHPHRECSLEKILANIVCLGWATSGRHSKPLPGGFGTGAIALA